MGNKLLINVFIPAARKTIEIRVDKSMKIIGLNGMLAEYLKGLGNSEFIPQSDAVLCDMETGEVYAKEHRIGRLNLKNGSTIMFV